MHNKNTRPLAKGKKKMPGVKYPKPKLKLKTGVSSPGEREANVVYKEVHGMMVPVRVYGPGERAMTAEQLDALLQKKRLEKLHMELSALERLDNSEGDLPPWN